MPIILPKGLASAAALRSEGVNVLHHARGDALRVGFINLMPDMGAAERQFARLLGSTRRDVELVLALPASYRAGHPSAQHYARWGATSLPDRLDGLIVTGAPLEHLAFEDVTYWNELALICDWAANNAGNTLYVCWAAFAALHRFHGAGKRILPRKISGVFRQHVIEAGDPLTAGLGHSFPCPVSRHAEIEPHTVPWRRGLACLAQSPESGLCLISDAPHNAYYMFNHLEYEADTLKHEYLRDRDRRADVAVPQYYAPGDDISKAPPLVWRRAAETLFANWLSILAAAGGREVASGSRAA